MLYFVGMLRRDAGTDSDSEISRRLWLISASLLDKTSIFWKREKRMLDTHSLWTLMIFFHRSFSTSPGSACGTVISFPFPLMIKPLSLSFPPRTTTLLPTSPTSAEDPTKPSSCLIFVSKFDNARYSFFN